MGYEIGGDRVRYGAKPVRGADVATFEILLPPWARDRSAVYFEGRKVSRARPDTFRPISTTVGCDAKRIYFRSRSSGDMNSTSYSGAMRFDPDSARVVEKDGRTFLVSNAVWAVDLLLVGLGLDPASFEPLGRDYCRDASRVVWLQSNALPKRLEEADAATFVVDDAGARDRHGPFVSGARDAGLLPVQREADPRAAATRLIEDLWRESLQQWFADFERSVLTDDGFARIGTAPAEPLPVPVHRLRIDGARLVLEAGERVCEGTVSGMELLGGWLYGVARRRAVGDDVCIRVMLQTDGAIVSREGTPPRWQKCLDLAYLFDKLGLTQEALFLVQRTQRWKPTDGRNTTPEDSEAVRREKLLGALVTQIPPEVHPKGATTQAAMSWMIDKGLHRSPDALVRRDVASSIAPIARQTMIQRARLATIAVPTLSLLDDPEPAVRAEAAASFDFLCSQTFNKQAYPAALPYAEALCARGINLDVQSARRWECLAALGRMDEAERAWATCVRLVSNDPFPAATAPTFGTSYPDFDAWRAAGERRVSLNRVASGGVG